MDDVPDRDKTAGAGARSASGARQIFRALLLDKGEGEIPDIFGHPLALDFKEAGVEPMKIVKWLLIAAGAYILLVIVFETSLGVLQPDMSRTGFPMMVITTTDESGVANDRMLAEMETDGRLYVSAHHWPQGWYQQALRNPQVQATVKGVTAEHIAVPVEGEEYARVVETWPLPFRMKFLMGFAPRNLLRLDPTPSN